MTGPATPRISVICAFFNAERYLAETVESVLAQDHDDFELLLIDDGSTDRGRALAKEYAARDRRVVLLTHPGHANRGTCASRNLGLHHAGGEYVAFIDADDVWRSSKLRNQSALLDRMPHVDAVCGSVNFWSSHEGGSDEIIPTGHVQNRAVKPSEGLRKIYPLGKADPPCPSDLMMRRSIVEKIGGFEEGFVGPLQLYEDQEIDEERGAGLQLRDTCPEAGYRVRDVVQYAEAIAKVLRPIRQRNVIRARKMENDVLVPRHARLGDRKGLVGRVYAVQPTDAPPDHLRPPPRPASQIEALGILGQIAEREDVEIEIEHPLLLVLAEFELGVSSPFVAEALNCLWIDVGPTH